MTELHDQRPLSRVELLVLAGLSAAKGATEPELAKSLRKTGMPLDDAALTDCVSATLASLGARGLCAAPPEPAKPAAVKPASKPRKPRRPRVVRFTLTENGRLSLRHAFGTKITPSWKDMCNYIVPALALGEQPGSAGAEAALGSVESMLASLLRRDRALGEVGTVAELCDRIVARAIGMPPGAVTPGGVRAYALAVHCGVSSKSELENVAARFAPTKTAKGAKKARPEAELSMLATQLADQRLHVERKAKPTKATIVQSLQRYWVSHQDEADDAQRPSTLRWAPIQSPRSATVAAIPASTPPFTAPISDAAEGLLVAVREAIPMVGSDGRYGKENVFVSALWRQVAGNQRLTDLSLDGFKRWLVTANRNQLLALARADLVDDMDARLVEDSEIEDLGATFHFVIDRRDPSSASGQVHYAR
ncbi:MAG: hypothetical protein ABIY55_33085 [Kofleriaceae bacterium]